MNYAHLKSLTFPDAAYFSTLLAAGGGIIDACEHYQKRSDRNRYRVAGGNGIVTLSIPLLRGKNEQMPIRDVRIAYAENWPRIHAATLRAAYGKSAYFEHYYDDLEKLLESRPVFLWDLNRQSLMLMLTWLKLSVQITDSGDYLPDCPDTSTLGYKPYAQVFEPRFGFISGLSAIDLVMNTGPEAVRYLKW
ncbi:MAG: WbqC family protein [Saprospiraceae bacterium]|nr:WbqC family protein [Saprospiraceae bacterium]